MTSWKQRLSQLIYVEQAGRCHYCNRMCVPSDGKRMTNEEQPPDLWTLDHIDPKLFKGEMTRSNTIGACRACNLLRGHRRKHKFEKQAKRFRVEGDVNESLYRYFGRWWPITLNRLRRDIEHILAKGPCIKY